MPTVTILLQRVTQGSQSAFLGLVNRMWDRQLSFSRLLMRNTINAKDQDDLNNLVFYQLWDEVQLRRPITQLLNSTDGLLAVLRLYTCQQLDRIRRDESRHKRDYRRTILQTDLAADSSTAAQHEHAVRTAYPVDPADWPTSLTPRQRHIVTLLNDGWLREELPSQLHCSLRTIRREIVNIQMQFKAQQ
jgi:hypothetical protein